MNLRTDAGSLSTTQVCALFGLSRTAWYEAKRSLSQENSDETAAAPRPARELQVASPRGATVEALMPAIHAIVQANPAWGVRKVWAVLRRKPYELKVSQRRVWALMSARNLTLVPNSPRKDLPPRGQVVTPEPNRRWATDLTTVQTKDDGTVAVVPVVDCGCRSVLAIEVTKAQTAPAVLVPLQRALTEVFGLPGEVPDGLELRTDHGPQYTGSDCHDLVKEWRVEHTFAPVGRPTGNAVAERTIRTLKEECIWLQDWNNIEELRAAMERWRRAFNEDRPHQSLDWQTPQERRDERLNGDLLAAA